MKVAWKSRCQDLSKFYYFPLLSNWSDLEGGEEYMEAVTVYHSDMKSRRLKQSLNSLGNHVVYCLYRFNQHVILFAQAVSGLLRVQSSVEATLH